jgi:HPt (histidine-containing phosphotransfer) domain-containing protein
MLAEIYLTFQGSLGGYLAALRAAVSQRDGAGLATTAHGLKGAGASVGADWLADLARRLETFGRQGTLAGAEELLAELESEAGRVEVEIRELLATVR